MYKVMEKGKGLKDEKRVYVENLPEFGGFVQANILPNNNIQVL